ncbi:S8 family serine peptidase [Palleronia sp. LCG004]|uniref:S8 family serine peptidase n=1 Tax=Palleronia sp. LCG004 TaxID=3079304 RepID=UPI0029422A44|nr:S8 family serine peptidase [Palleronia sp. LCG004]WOI58098.1 S8 family serine peptidase [Palleronia sp. LCG004]
MSDAVLDVLRPRPTGGTLVTFRPGMSGPAQIEAVERAAGAGAIRIAGSETPPGGEAILVFEEIGIAIVPAREDGESVAAALGRSEGVERTRPEFWLFDTEAGAGFEDDTERSWGLAATGAIDSPRSGDGIRLCVLDTGIDAGHPDYRDRSIVSQSFVTGEEVMDAQGHGTHCAGTAAGRSALPGVPRYGVAPGASLHVGKVLNDQGSGRERDIIAGMLWAVRQGCEVISMSLGRAVRPGEVHSTAYERIGRLALDSGSLIVAAAGNDSRRQVGYIAPAGAPANSPSILSVAALDEMLAIAPFSNGGINPDGGGIDLAAPGVDVLSSVPRPRDYRALSGTSMATPHVAGVAALWAESDPALRGAALWDRLIESARKLPLSARDVGAGLVQAPPPARGDE